jgi:hypothetical protein
LLLPDGKDGACHGPIALQWNRVLAGHHRVVAKLVAQGGTDFCAAVDHYHA